LISPRQDEGLFVSAENVVMVCHQHHPPTAGDSPENEYVPTLMSDGIGFEIPDCYPMPGAKVRVDCPRWTCANVYQRSESERPQAEQVPAAHGSYRCSAVGETALDRALAEPL
jgi:hypothetical protein